MGFAAFGKPLKIVCKPAFLFLPVASSKIPVTFQELEKEPKRREKNNISWWTQQEPRAPRCYAAKRQYVWNNETVQLKYANKLNNHNAGFPAWCVISDVGHHYNHHNARHFH